MTDPQHPALPAAAAQSWRSWLLTGMRREPVDRRRLRGSHLGLKRVLVEDLAVRGEPPYRWKEFSDAMLRHAIGDAVRTLPEQDSRMLKLAYFGGFSNREIATQVGISESAVASRLRRAITSISDRIQTGGATLRRAAFAISAWFCGHWCESWVHRAAEASAVVAVAMMVSTSASPAVGPTQSGPSALARPHPAPAASQAAPAPAEPGSAFVTHSAPQAPVTTPAVTVPAAPPVQLAVPPIPAVLPSPPVPPLPLPVPKLPTQLRA